MRTAQHGDVPRGVWLAILAGFVVLLPFSLLLFVLSPLAGFALLAVIALVGRVEWRAWRRSHAAALTASPRRYTRIEKASGNVRNWGIAVLGVIVALLVWFGSGFFDEWGVSSAPGDPSSVGVIDSDAFWSPDSRLIAFDRSDYGPPGDTPSGASDVFVASADGDSLRPLTQTPESETVLGWLEHPLRIVYSRGPTGVYALDLMEGAPVLLGSLRATDSLVALSHDARRALVCTPSGDPKRYALVDFGRGTRHPLPGAASYWPDGAWSPDDSMLAYPTDENIVILRGDRVLRRVPLGPAVGQSAAGGLAWSPDGLRLAYGSWWAYDSSLWTLRVADGSRSQLAKGGESAIQNPVWSPDGRTIYYEYASFGDHDGLRAVAPDGTGDRKITDDDFDGGRWLEQARPSHDGTKISYVMGDAGDWKHWYLVGVMNADGSGKTPFSGSP